jgi:glycine/D-amino acid oxidase-like deaminating enzyme
VDGTPWDFGHELLNEQFDKIEDSVNFAYRRFPVLERSGVKRVIHGPFTFAPDGNPLIGPVPGLRNYWSACAVMAGFSQGGGMGLALAQWMIHGEVERDPAASTWPASAAGPPRLHRPEGHRKLPDALLRLLPERGTPRRPPLPHHTRCMRSLTA